MSQRANEARVSVYCCSECYGGIGSEPQNPSEFFSPYEKDLFICGIALYRDKYTALILSKFQFPFLLFVFVGHKERDNTERRNKYKERSEKR